MASSTPAPSPSPAPPTSSPAPTVEPTPAPSATPTAVVVRVPPGALALPRGAVAARPFAVMLDNHPDAYPQAGLNEAALVFEALAEFGITRYMAVFVPGISGDLPTLGPVRSARPYFVEWAKGLRAIYVHAGGSPEGTLLAETAQELINMDALRRVSGPYFRRSAERSAPHNLFTSSAEIGAFGAAQQTVPAEGLSEIGFVLKNEAPLEQRPASQTLSYWFIYRESYVGWSYDTASNSYRYFRQQRPHVDAVTGAQVRTTNLIVLEVPERRIPGDAKGRIEQQVIGEGRARIFRDGTVVEGIWRKPAGFAQLQLYGLDGAEIALNPGPTWIAAIPSLDNLQVEDGQ